LWVSKFFDESKIRKKLILYSYKNLLNGDYLIDDRRFNDASEYKEEWMCFGGDKFPDWRRILKYLKIE